jgi:hypothetical protein
MAAWCKLRLVVVASVSAASTLFAAGRVSAQLSADPYRPYNEQYEQYVYPSYPTGVGVVPNQAVLEGRGGSARSFQRYLEEEDEMDRASSNASVAPGRRGVGSPYYRAYRDYDETYRRVYTPNKSADETYLANRKTRDGIYSEYLRETDPKKKAALLKEYQEYSQKALRQLNQGRGRGTRPAAERANAPSRPRPPIPGSAPTPARGAAGGRSGEQPSPPARPSNAEILRRSEMQDRAPRPRPAPPSVPSRRPALDPE